MNTIKNATASTETNWGGGKIVKIPPGAIRNFPGIKFQFVEITPELAADWLKANRRNRKLKQPTVEAYSLDMQNGAWLLTHQGIAFDIDGNLTDGQHRLMGILQSKTPCVMLVSTGWPAEVKTRKTMDAVDRGCLRSLGDQLKLQHDIHDAGRVVQIANQIASACFGLTRVRKSTTDTVLAVVAIYRDEIKWLAENPVKTHGLKQAVVGGCVAIGRAVWPEKTAEFYRRLVTGENLASGNPILLLRNWLLGAGMHEHPAVMRLAICHHMHAFVEDRSLGSLVSQSSQSLIHILRQQKTRVEKVCAIYGQPVPELVAGRSATSVPATRPAAAGNGKTPIQFSEEGIRLGRTLNDPFTTLDVTARLDKHQGNAGLWLMLWANKGWVERVGSNAFRKTASFGK